MLVASCLLLTLKLISIVIYRGDLAPKKTPWNTEFTKGNYILSSFICSHFYASYQIFYMINGNPPNEETYFKETKENSDSQSHTLEIEFQPN